jgi:rRNA maturation RNase YbeY
MIDYLPALDPGEPKVLFFFHDISDRIEDLDQYTDWLIKVAELEGKQIHQLQIIFMSDKELLEMNRSFLGHDYYTDIITFPLNDDPLMAELYISLERVKDNALKLKVSEKKEVMRVMVHGVLHLCGYRDTRPEEKKEMRERENYYIRMLEK